MKNIVFTFFFLISFFSSHSQNITLEETRNLYQKSATDKQACEKLYAILNESQKDEDPVLYCYYGAVTANMANFTKEPSQKLKLFNSGRKLIEKAVLNDSTNLEIRFIRFTIQTNCPKSLKYDSAIPSDKAFLLENLRAYKNSGFRKKITSYLMTSESLTPEEKNKIKD